MVPYETHLQIGSLLFEGLDQIDLTGPFEVLSRIPNSTYRIYGKTTESVRDLKGLRLTPDATLAAAPPLDVLHVPGGFGHEALMEDERCLAGYDNRRLARVACFQCARAHCFVARPGCSSDGGPRRTGHRSTCCRSSGQSQSTSGWWWIELGVRGRSHGRDRRRLASRGRTARRRGRADGPALHRICA
jgi:hypothetical protein